MAGIVTHLFWRSTLLLLVALAVAVTGCVPKNGQRKNVHSQQLKTITGPFGTSMRLPDNWQVTISEVPPADDLPELNRQTKMLTLLSAEHGNQAGRYKEKWDVAAWLRIGKEKNPKTGPAITSAGFMPPVTVGKKQDFWAEETLSGLAWRTHYYGGENRRVKVLICGIDEKTDLLLKAQCSGKGCGNENEPMTSILNSFTIDIEAFKTQAAGHIQALKDAKWLPAGAEVFNSKALPAQQ